MTDYNPDDLAWLRNLEAIRLVEACWAHPEQYEAFLDARRVGYLRRHGHVTLGAISTATPATLGHIQRRRDLPQPTPMPMLAPSFPSHLLIYAPGV
jgi:hypothetical protein